MMNVTAPSPPLLPPTESMFRSNRSITWIFLLERMKELKDRIKPLNIKAAYQRPCSNSLIPDKLPLVKKILNLIGVKLPKRIYQDENCLCCGEILRSVSGYKLADDVQKEK